MTKIDFQYLRWKEQNRKKYFVSKEDEGNSPVVYKGPDDVLTFGKHKGTKIRDLPQEYIEWAILNLKDHQVGVFVRELQRRDPSFVVK